MRAMVGVKYTHYHYIRHFKKLNETKNLEGFCFTPINTGFYYALIYSDLH